MAKNKARRGQASGTPKTNFEKIVRPKLEQIEGWRKNGVSEQDIANNLGVSYSALRGYKGRHKALADALQRGYEHSNLTVQNAVFRSALGYTVQIQKTFKTRHVEYDPETGKRKREWEQLETGFDEMHVPANAQAQQFWLANRDREHWQYRPETREDAGEGGGIVLLPPVLEENADEAGTPQDDAHVG